MKISKASSTEIDDMRTAVADAQEAVETAVTEFNEALAVARAPLDEAISNYNDALAELKARLEAERDERQEEYDNKSERWQEGDKGQAAQEWIDGIGNAADTLDSALETDLPEAVEPFDFADLGEVEQLPDAPEA